MSPNIIHKRRVIVDEDESSSNKNGEVCTKKPHALLHHQSPNDGHENDEDNSENDADSVDTTELACRIHNRHEVCTAPLPPRRRKAEFNAAPVPLRAPSPVCSPSPHLTSPKEQMQLEFEEDFVLPSNDDDSSSSSSSSYQSAREVSCNHPLQKQPPREMTSGSSGLVVHTNCNHAVETRRDVHSNQCTVASTQNPYSSRVQTTKTAIQLQNGVQAVQSSGRDLIDLCDTDENDEEDTKYKGQRCDKTNNDNTANTCTIYNGLRTPPSHANFLVSTSTGNRHDHSGVAAGTSSPTVEDIEAFSDDDDDDDEAFGFRRRLHPSTMRRKSWDDPSPQYQNNLRQSQSMPSCPPFQSTIQEHHPPLQSFIDLQNEQYHQHNDDYYYDDFDEEDAHAAFGFRPTTIPQYPQEHQQESTHSWHRPPLCPPRSRPCAASPLGSGRAPAPCGPRHQLHEQNQSLSSRIFPQQRHDTATKRYNLHATGLPYRNDLIGGSGVGAGAYQVLSAANDKKKKKKSLGPDKADAAETAVAARNYNTKSAASSSDNNNNVASRRKTTSRRGNGKKRIAAKRGASSTANKKRGNHNKTERTQSGGGNNNNYYYHSNYKKQRGSSSSSNTSSGTGRRGVYNRNKQFAPPQTSVWNNNYTMSQRPSGSHMEDASLRAVGGAEMSF